MVFRGKPSKACKRCRERKLRCDLREAFCSSCIRAGVQCTGYRDTSTLRIADQTAEAKALSKKARSPAKQQDMLKVSKSLPLGLQDQARNLFFASYIADFSRTWDFLCPYFDSRFAPEHLTLSIDAVSLALLSYQVYSSAALAMSRQKYVAALRKTNTALQRTETARNKTTLDASLLLDLFEKIDSRGGGQEDTHRAHVNGALALVKLRGLDRFTDDASLRALMRLTMNLIISCVSTEDPAPEELHDIRAHMGRYVDIKDPKWRLSGLMIETTDLVSETSKRKLSHDLLVAKYVSLDKKFEKLGQEAPLPFRRIFANDKSDKILNGYFDVYPDRTVTQMWNVFRLARIILCEDVIETCSRRDDKFSTLHTKRAYSTIEIMIQEICASVPQMTDCSFAARHKILPETLEAHSHTLSHYLDVYILIFALYVAAWSRNCPLSARTWIENQLEYIAEHFGVKESAVVRKILREDGNDVRVGPWDVYRLLGSYAFAA